MPSTQDDIFYPSATNISLADEWVSHLLGMKGVGCWEEAKGKVTDGADNII